MERLWSIVEFEDGLEVIPSRWLSDNEKNAWWPPFKSRLQFNKVVQHCSFPKDDWDFCTVRRILATANTYDKALYKLKQAEFISDINSDNDPEELKKSRKDRAKKVISNTDSDTDNETNIPLPPKILQIQKSNSIINNGWKGVIKQKQQCETAKERFVQMDKHGRKENIDPKQIYVNHTVTATCDDNEDTLHSDASNVNNTTSSKSPFQRYVVRKLTEIGFKISSQEEKCSQLCRKLDLMFDHLQTAVLPREVENREILNNVMSNFPINNVEDLVTFEKSVTDGVINRNNLIKELSYMGGKDIKGLTFNLLRKLMTDQLACSFSYVGGKKKESFYDLQLRNIIFRVVRVHFPEATELCVAEPIKSWLRHANERNEKKHNTMTVIFTDNTDI